MPVWADLSLRLTPAAYARRRAPLPQPYACRPAAQTDAGGARGYLRRLCSLAANQAEPQPAAPVVRRRHRHLSHPRHLPLHALPTSPPQASAAALSPRRRLVLRQHQQLRALLCHFGVGGRLLRGCPRLSPVASPSLSGSARRLPPRLCLSPPARRCVGLRLYPGGGGRRQRRRQPCPRYSPLDRGCEPCCAHLSCHQTLHACHAIVDRLCPRLWRRRRAA